MSTDYRGPTADDLLPTQRINEGVMYQEHLVQMFGDEQALRGVPLEVIDAAGGELKSDAAGKKRKATILITFKGPDGKPIAQKLGINQTIKKALITRFGSRYLVDWVGWVTLYVDPNVEDKRTGDRVRAIRIKNVAPKLAPTFDYSKNTEARKERARKALAAKGTATKQTPTVQLTDEQRAALDAAEREPRTEPSDLGSQIAEQMDRHRQQREDLSDDDKAAILASERAQHEFTADPDGES